jgi:hypothetical protein
MALSMTGLALEPETEIVTQLNGESFVVGAG